jgi:hypothetical protein
MPVTGGYGNSGAPDFIICIAGLFYGIETKANGGKATALQLKNHDDIRKAGGIALIVDETNVENLRKELLSHVQSKEHSVPSQQGEVNQGSGKGHKVKRSVRVLRALG